MNTPANVGKRIATLRQLSDAANARRAVWARVWNRHSPAVWMLNMQGPSIQRFIDSGMYLCKRGAK